MLALKQGNALIGRDARISRALPDHCRSVLPPRPTGIKSAAARKANVRTMAATDEEVSTVAVAGAALAIPFELICFWSEYTVVTTGEGLQGDILGGLEGIAYCAVLGMVAWSLKTKVATGSGLPAGPSGLIGASEGLAYLALLGFAAFFFHN